MFGFLKKKVEDFASKITKKAEEKLEQEPKETPKPVKKKEKPKVKKEIPKPVEEKKSEPIKEEPSPEPIEEKPPEPKIEEPEPIVEKPPEPIEEEPKKKQKLSLVSKLRRAVVGEISLSEKEIDDFLWEFELALLEADVAQPVAEEIISELKKRLAETKFSRNQDIGSEVEKTVQEAIKTIITVEGFSIQDKIKKGEKPFVIMFLGPNGAGKTTTLAKIAHMLKKQNLSSVFAASDTFRAASIEQLQHHADALGIKMIKHDYGADPAAVAFDAIKSAEAKNIDCVLIDTAGRQETNKNLMEELKKIKRVAKPHLLIYLDEALAGNALVDRVSQFKNEIGVDGVILSKMDMDVKGGGTISISRVTGVPIIYYGMGQSYDDLAQFNAEELLKRVFG